MKVALIYDRVNKFGGAERVLLALHKLFPNAPLYTSVYNPQTAKWARVFRVKTSFLQNFPFAKKFHELYAPLMPFAFLSFDLKTYDLVISVTSEYAKSIKVGPKTKHICYCLTPTRYLWSGYQEYFGNVFLKVLTFPVIFFLRMQDRYSAQRPDGMIAISKEVQRRIRMYYNRDSIVVYPPVTLETSTSRSTVKFSNSNFQIPNKSQNTKYKIRNTTYFLVVSRLVAYKRIDIAVKACNTLKIPLKIIGSGWEIKRLKAIAGPTIEFLGNLTDEQLIRYYKGCCGLIFPGLEDFGISIAEAQFFGKPVIAFGKGGALETVENGKTGLFFKPQTSEALIKTIKEFRKKRFNPKDCIKNSKRFTSDRFGKELMEQIRKLGYRL